MKDLQLGVAAEFKDFKYGMSIENQKLRVEIQDVRASIELKFVEARRETNLGFQTLSLEIARLKSDLEKMEYRLIVKLSTVIVSTLTLFFGIAIGLIKVLH